MLFWKRDPRRKQFFIKKEFQGKFILFFALSVVVPASLSVAVLYSQARLELEKHFFSSHLKITNTGEIFRDLLIRINLFSAALIIILVILLSLYIFHRLNIHFQRMEMRFEAMGQGDFSPSPQPPSRFNEISTLINLAEHTRENYRQRFQKIDDLLLCLEESLQGEGEIADLDEHSQALAEHLKWAKLPDSPAKES